VEGFGVVGEEGGGFLGEEFKDDADEFAGVDTPPFRKRGILRNSHSTYPEKTVLIVFLGSQAPDAYPYGCRVFSL
jgi:hypothetical protein